MFMIALLMFFHFFTDYFANYSLLTLGLSYDGIGWVFLSYNILAFLFQPLFGFWVDKTTPKHFVTASMVMLVIGFLLIPVFIWGGVLFLGLANAIFHVAGGKIILDGSPKKWPLGAFVAPGAIGLACAWAFKDNETLALCASILALLATVLFQFVKPKAIAKSNTVDPIHVDGLIFVAFAIVIRAFLGKYVSYDIPWVYWALLAGIAAGLGKLAGGFLADLLGVNRTVILSTALGIVSLFFLSNPVLSLIGIFSINMAMPITLHLMVRAMPGYSATAFGLAAMSLIPGFYLGVYLAGFYTVWLAIGLMAVNILIILWANHRLKKIKEVSLCQ